jgi:hypothetical protein
MIVLYLIESYGSYVPYIVEILWFLCALYCRDLMVLMCLIHFRFLYKHRHSYGSYVPYTLQILVILKVLLYHDP